MRPATVWVVDDDEDDQLFIRATFEQGEPPIAVMPRKNGFETLKELRAMVDYTDLPVVMLTTSSGVANRRQALALGANQFLTKPLSHDQLQAMAKALINQWQLT